MQTPAERKRLRRAFKRLMPFRIYDVEMKNLIIV
jgi:hypothetical protein